MKTLKQRTVHSGSWVILGHFISQILRLGSNLIITRLLVPEMFGVMAIVTVLIAGSTMFSDIGLLQNIVHSKRGEERVYLNTAWSIQIVRGFVIFLMAVMLSGVLYYLGRAGWLSVETVYGNSELPMILSAVAVTAIVSGFNSIHILVLNRKLMMSRLVIIELVSQIIGIAFMVVWAWFQRDIWALVFGGIVSASLKMMLSHSSLVGGKCELNWDRGAANEIFHFGKWVFLSSILGFLLNQGDRILLGGLISSDLLGVYTIAFFLANALRDVFSKLLSSVFFPLLSELVRQAPEKLESVYYRVRLKIDMVTIPTAGFLFSTGGVLISILYDVRYAGAGWMLEILSISLVSTGYMLADQLFLSYGKPKYASFMVLVQAVSLYIFVPVMFMCFGLMGAIFAVAINPIVKVFVTMVVMKRVFFLNIYREVMLVPLFPIGYLVGEQFKKVFF
ncbi:oligosaccharide flippase family protein [uncultured Cycloclasticus sp.]|uniref:oligosaccharide flippase family protein n=1 Tax=uncultured Cycloclasticus sp. TaxID=172194 RepID=UPI00258DEDDC|nr:oligosaccharide flippase family protein [uncultured Cycloclasticus sp.]